MPLRPLSREQAWLLPPNLDELIPPNHPVRFVAAVIDAMGSDEWAKLGIAVKGEALGAPAYHPRALLGVWVYGFMTKVRSSRKLEAACRDQMPYLWLTGWQYPDHNTLWRFYQQHRDRMRELLKRTVQLAGQMGLSDMAIQAVDGTKIAANVDKQRTYNADGLRELLEKTEAAIRDLEEQNEAGKDPPPARLPEELAKAERLRAEVKAAVERLGQEKRKHINLTDGDARLMKTRQGVAAGYNAQAVVTPVGSPEGQPPGKAKAALLITAADVVSKTTDTAQLMPMLKQAEENSGKRADISLADAGYHSGANLEACDLRQQVVVMPESQDRAREKPYHKDRFAYDKVANSYICPHGQRLISKGTTANRGKLVRVYGAPGEVCRNCSAFGTCTTSNQGRKLEIRPEEAALRRHRAWMETEEAKAAYKKRKELAEPVFGIIKEQMGVRRFLLRGLANVTAEFIMVAIAFNLRTLNSFASRMRTGKPSAGQINAARRVLGVTLAIIVCYRPSRVAALPAETCLQA